MKSWVDGDFNIDNAAPKSPAKLTAIKRDVDKRHSSALLRTLIRCRGTDCTDGRDKIFSVLGMYQLATGTGLRCKDRLYPNYGLHTAVVYTNAAVEILERMDDLALLTVAEGEDFRDRQKWPHMPSWVPDWTFGTLETPLGLGITGYERFNASGDLERDIAFLDDHKVLRVKAARLDRIVRVGETREAVRRGGKFDQWLELFNSEELEHHTKQNRQDAFWRTLITDTETDGRCPAPYTIRAGFLQWITEKATRIDNEYRQKVAESFPSGEVTDETEECSEEFELQYAHVLLQRPVSTSGGRLGLGTQSIKIYAHCAKDQEHSIWIVCGSRVPLVFRGPNRRARYNLVGGAYVHGFMACEALQLDEKLRFGPIDLE